MKTILHIDSSARSFTDDKLPHQSISRQLAKHFIQHYTELQPNTEIIYRDLAKDPASFIDQDWIAACFTDEPNDTQTQTLSESDTLISEIEVADLIVMSAPMYNYGMPAVLKAWFDQVIRVNKTFSFDLARGDKPLAPILSGKQMLLCTSCGESDFGEGQENAAMNHLGSHIKQLSRYLGAETFYEVTSEYQEFSDKRHEQSLLAAKHKAQSLAVLMGT